ncbi:MAG: hypothetical protein ACOH1Y_08425 [Propionicimonas sp.]
MDLAARDWLPILRRTVGTAAIVMALAVVGVWAGNVTLTHIVVDTVGTHQVIDTLMTLGWIEIVAGAVVVLGLAAGLWFHRPLWAPGVLAVVLGMALHWGWWVLDRKVDLFGTSGFNDPDPELLQRAAVRMWVMFGADAIAVLMLLSGAVLLFRTKHRSGQPDSPSDRSGQAADDDHDDVGRFQLQRDAGGDQGEYAGVEGNARTATAERVQHSQ